VGSQWHPSTPLGFRRVLRDARGLAQRLQSEWHWLPAGSRREGRRVEDGGATHRPRGGEHSGGRAPSGVLCTLWAGQVSACDTRCLPFTGERAFSSYGEDAGVFRQWSSGPQRGAGFTGSGPSTGGGEGTRRLGAAGGGASGDLRGLAPLTPSPPGGEGEGNQNIRTPRPSRTP
jgi:hypothetical protein